VKQALSLSPRLSLEDQQHLERIIRALPLLADVTHADSSIVGYDPRGEPVVLAHAPPASVPSLHTTSLVGRRYSGDRAALLQRLLSQGRRHAVVSGALVRGAPTMQEFFPILGPSGAVIGVLQSEMAMPEHQRQRKKSGELRRAIAQFRDLVLQGRVRGAERISRLKLHDGILVIDERGVIRYISAVAENMYLRLGYMENLVNTLLSDLDTNEYICFKAMEHGECLEQRIEEQDVIWIKKVIPLLRTGSGGWFRRRGANGNGCAGALIFIVDITDEVRKEQELKIKTAMIHEIHHRVKNNLQTIAALLRMQARRSSPEVAELLRQSVSRIQSIAVVHEFLSKDESRVINMHEVFNRIMNGIVQGTLDPDKHIQLHLDGTSEFLLPSQQATSCALIVNELLQNAVEHGYAGLDQGDIWVRLGQTPDSMCIEIEDNGSGLPEGFDVERDGGLGLQIVRTLVQEDLKGRFELENGVGVRIRITFPRRQFNERKAAVS
jgi:two-component sensor histidine kinase